MGNGSDIHISKGVNQNAHLTLILNVSIAIHLGLLEYLHPFNRIFSELTYDVSIDSEKNLFIIKSESIVENSVAVNIPDSDKRKKQYISLFLHKLDIEEGIEFLRCISADKHFRINQSLFVSALSNMVKCFQNDSACNKISEDRFQKTFPNESSELSRFIDWRNKHFVHDENSMREAIAFLFVAPEGSEQILGGSPSVVWNRAPIDFLSEGRKLEFLMLALLQFIYSEIDTLSEKLSKEYGQKTRTELLSYGVAEIKLSTLENPGQNRNA